MAQAGGGAAAEGAELGERGVRGEEFADALHESFLAAHHLACRATQRSGQFADRRLFFGFRNRPAILRAALYDFATDGREALGDGHSPRDARGGAIDAVADAIAEGGGILDGMTRPAGIGEGPRGDAVSGGEADDAGRRGGVVAGFFVAESATAAALGNIRDADGAMSFVDEAADGEVDAGHGVGGEGAVARRVVGADGLDEGEAAFLEEFGEATAAAMAGDPVVEAVEGEVDEGEVRFDEAALAGAEGVEGDGGAGRHGSSS